MVNIIILFIPPVVVFLSYFLQLHCCTEGNVSRIYTAVVHGTFSFITVIALLLAVYKNRKNPFTRKAWLLFLFGIILFIPSGIIRYFTGIKYPWFSSMLFLIALIPIVIFINIISRPMRHIIYSKSNRVYLVLLVSIILVVIISSFIIPVFTDFNKSINHEKKLIILNIFKPLFNILLITPISGVLLLLGLKKDNYPYFLIGFGFFCALLGDILNHYYLLSGIPNFLTFSKYTGTAELLYIMLGGLTEAFKGQSEDRSLSNKKCS